jgi:hypothetical protein
MIGSLFVWYIIRKKPPPHGQQLSNKKSSILGYRHGSLHFSVLKQIVRVHRLVFVVLVDHVVKKEGYAAPKSDVVTL